MKRKMYRVVRSLEAFEEISLNPSLPLFCDTETCYEEGFTADGKGLYGKIRLVQLFQDDMKEAILIDCFCVPLETTLALLQPFFIVFHNASYDLHTINLKTPSTWLPAEVGDTLYLSRLKYNTKLKFGFYECLEYSGNADELINSIDKKEEQKFDWGGPLLHQQKVYAAADVIYLARLHNSVKEFEDSHIYKLDITNLRHAVHYSRRGMPVDRQKIAALKKEYNEKAEASLEALPINPNSSLQCCEYLGTKSSAVEVLDELALEGNERAKAIKNARHYIKTLSFLNAYDRDWVKGFFNPCAAISGRFSCTGGSRYDHHNAQQIPRALQHVFMAPEGYVLVHKDYSGVELRMAAAYVGEPVMAAMLKSGADLHYEADLVIFPGQTTFTTDERNVAKVLNFSLIYGAGIKAIRQKLKLTTGVTSPFEKIKAMVDNWFELYQYFREWHTMSKNQHSVYGYIDIETALGRKIRTYNLTDSFNYPIQGSACEVQKVALGLLYSRYPDIDLVNTVHDCNLLLSPEDKADMWGKRLDECMVEAWEYVIKDLAEPDIPMPHGYDIGKWWDFH